MWRMMELGAVGATPRPIERSDGQSDREDKRSQASVAAEQ